MFTPTSGDGCMPIYCMPACSSSTTGAQGITGMQGITGAQGITGVQGPPGSGGGGTGSPNYTLTGQQVVATSTSFADLGYFPWKQSSYGSYPNGRIIYRTIIADRNLNIQIIDGLSLSVLGGPDIITSNGTNITNFTNPSSDTYLTVQISKSSAGGTSPSVLGVNVEF